MADNTVRLRATLDDKVSGPLSKIRDQFDRLGGKGSSASLFGNVGAKAVSAGFDLIADASSAAIGVLRDSITAASDQREAMALNEQVFKDGSAAVDAWSDTTAKAFGVAKTDAITFAATFGNTLKAAGLSADELGAKSITLTERAADLGSAFNASGEEVATAIRSGLVGESEPMRRFGVLLSEAKVKAKGLSMGLGNLKGELTEGEKVLARYELILEESSDSAGMFGRDVDSLADKQKQLTARWEDAQVSLGNVLIPKVTELAEAFLSVADAAEAISDAIGDDLGPTVEDFGEVVTTAFRPDKVVKFALDWKTTIDQWAARFKLGGEEVTTAVETMKGNAVADLGTVAGSARDLGSAATGMADTVSGAVTSMAENIDRAFDPIELALDAQGNHYKVLAGIVELSEAKGKVAHNDARTAIVAALDDEATSLRELGERHKLTGRQVETFRGDVNAAFKAIGRKVPPELKKVLRELDNLADYDGRHINIDITTRMGRNLRGARAGGGPVDPNRVYLVGEEGPELFVARSAGDIVPNHALRTGGGPVRLAGASGGTPVVNLTYAPQFSSASAAEAQRFMRAIVPELTRELRRQSVL